MTPRTLVARLSAFGCGAIVAFVALVAYEELQAAKVIKVHTCVDTDGTLRVTESNIPCEPEQRRIRLNLIREEGDECKEDDGRVERLERRLKDLEARDRRGTLRGRRVLAPFEVVMPKGDGYARLMLIEEQNVTFYNSAQQPVAWMRADNRGGLLVTESVGGNRTALIAAQENRAHVLIKENDKDRIDLGRADTGRYSLRVYGAQDKMVAGFGQSKGGPGLLVVADAAGVEKATMFVDSSTNAGRVDVNNGAGASVGVIRASARAGLLQLTDGGGTVMIEAGVNPDGAAVVRTGPKMRNPGVGIVGLVPSMIIGKP